MLYCLSITSQLVVRTSKCLSANVKSYFFYINNKVTHHSLFSSCHIIHLLSLLSLLYSIINHLSESLCVLFVSWATFALKIRFLAEPDLGPIGSFVVWTPNNHMKSDCKQPQEVFSNDIWTESLSRKSSKHTNQFWWSVASLYVTLDPMCQTRVRQ